jgi:SH3-like domain-containing protein
VIGSVGMVWLGKGGARSRVVTLLLLLSCVWLNGCGRFKQKPVEHYVYVTTKQGNLRDRVAAVSNRTAAVANGDRLKVLDHARHWVKVETQKGETGWIEERAVVTEEAAAEFDKLKALHKDDVEVASGVVRDQVNLHIKPGRDTDHFFILAEGDKLKLLRRATLEKVGNQAASARSQRAIPQAAGSNAARKDANGAPIAQPAAKLKEGEVAAGPVMEDWWLVRDSAGHTGWLYSRMVDVDAPDALTRYAEGQKFVGAYVLTTVHDEGAPGEKKEIPVYLTVLSPYKAGLPYDFDQVRVFTWSLKMHRYETGFREKNIEGYLPVEIKKMKDPFGKSAIAQQELPAFSYKVLSAEAGPVVPDATTGEMVPGKLITRTFRLEGNTLRRIGPSAGEMLARPVVAEKKDGSGGKRKRR